MTEDLEKVLGGVTDATEAGLASGSLDTAALGSLLKDYLRLCGEVQTSEPDEIRRAQGVLGRAVIVHAHQKSPVYGGRIDPAWLADDGCLGKAAGAFVVEKGDLADRGRWYTGAFGAITNKTSGTTGAPFEYRIWEDAYFAIERDRHYKMILDEFGVTDPRVVHIGSPLAVSGYYPHESGLATVKVADRGKFHNPYASLLCSHGEPSADYYHVIFDSDAFLHVHDYFHFLLDFIQKKKINVVLAPGGFFELLTTFLISDDTSAFPKVADLLSNTGDHTNQETLNFLKETGVASAWCDHMRCWDGGASFFTCKHGTYHVQDELAYVFTAPDGRLASVDFFSYPSPFVNYANGDYASVSDAYSKCPCGRWYREFKFHNRRPRQHEDANGGYYDTKEVARRLLGKYSLGFVSTQDGSVSIEDSMLDAASKKAIVEDMAKLYVMVHFFTSPMLSRLGALPAGQDCSSCIQYELSCYWNYKGGGGYYCTA